MEKMKIEILNAIESEEKIRVLPTLLKDILRKFSFADQQMVIVFLSEMADEGIVSMTDINSEAAFEITGNIPGHLNEDIARWVVGWNDRNK